MAINPVQGYGLDLRLDPSSPLVRSIENTVHQRIRVRLNMLPFPAEGTPVLLHYLDHYTSLGELDSYITHFTDACGAVISSIHLLRILNDNYRVAAVAYIRKKAGAKAVVKALNEDPDQDVMRGGVPFTFTNVQASLLHGFRRPDELGILDCFVSEYTDWKYREKSHLLSRVATDVRERLGDAGELWRTRTDVWEGLGFLYLPDDEVNGTPIVKDPHTFPVGPQLPFLPFPHVPPAAPPVIPPPEIAPYTAAEIEAMLTEFNKTPPDDDADDGEVEFLIPTVEVDEGAEHLEWGEAEEGDEEELEEQDGEMEPGVAAETEDVHL